SNESLHVWIKKHTVYIPLPADDDLLTTRELELSTTECLLCMMAIVVLASDGKKHLTNSNPSTCSKWLSKSSSHTSLKPISSSTREHLVDPKNMERMHSDPQVECILSGKFRHVLVAGNPSSFQCLT
ncbi:hypothetical protein KIW84_052183, partial [Lathyrus oleraceus]